MHTTTTYGYDANDRLVSVTDPYGKTVSYAYDILGNRTAITYPEGQTVTHEYDAINRLSKVTDWLGGKRPTPMMAPGTSRLLRIPMQP